MNNNQPINGMNQIPNNQVPTMQPQNQNTQPNQTPLNVFPPNVTFKESNMNNIATNQMMNQQPQNSQSIQKEDTIVIQQHNRFFNNDIEQKDTKITGLETMNVDGTYNNMPKVDYMSDEKVQANLKAIEENQNKNNTITITAEMKVFIVIIVVLLGFVFLFPEIYEFIKNIKY